MLFNFLNCKLKQKTKEENIKIAKELFDSGQCDFFLIRETCDLDINDIREILLMIMS